MEIMNRLNEIACHNVLAAELAALPPSVRLTSYDADARLLDLPISSKFNGEAEFLSELFEAGRAAAHLAQHPAPPARRGGLKRHGQLPAPTPRHSLSARLFRLTIGIVLAVEVLVFVPELAHERHAMAERAAGRCPDRGPRAAGSARTSRSPPPPPPSCCGCPAPILIRLQQPGRPPVTLAGAGRDGARTHRSAAATRT